jgi:hypothetical protein
VVGGTSGEQRLSAGEDQPCGAAHADDLGAGWQQQVADAVVARAKDQRHAGASKVAAGTAPVSADRTMRRRRSRSMVQLRLGFGAMRFKSRASVDDVPR